MAIKAAPNTENVCANPASVAECEIDETKSDPAATVPEVPTPDNT